MINIDILITNITAPNVEVIHEDKCKLVKLVFHRVKHSSY